MFGKKKQKQETLVRMRNLAQLDEGFFAHMKDGKDMFDAISSWEPESPRYRKI